MTPAAFSKRGANSAGLVTAWLAAWLCAAPVTAAVRVGSPEEDPGSDQGTFYRGPSMFVTQLAGVRRFRFRDQSAVGEDPLAEFSDALVPLFLVGAGPRAGGSSTRQEARFQTRFMEVRSTGLGKTTSRIAAPAVETTQAVEVALAQPLISTLDADALERRLATYLASSRDGQADVKQMVLAASPSPIAYITDPSQSGQITAAMLAGAASSAQLFPRLGQSQSRARGEASADATHGSELSLNTASRLVPEPTSLVIWLALAATAGALRRAVRR